MNLQAFKVHNVTYCQVLSYKVWSTALKATGRRFAAEQSI